MPPKGSTYRVTATTTTTTANDSFSYDDSALTKQKLAAQAFFAGRGRRNGTANAVANGTPSKDLSHLAALANAGAQAQLLNDGPILEWSKMDREILHAYRTAYRLSSPASFKNGQALAMLASPIGKSSPTMARSRDKRRITKEQLATQVRKTFNDMAVVENDTVLDVMYKLRNKDKTFRLKFPAIKSKQ